jgi:drug/metabolite transporter (DMT)-like permease
MGWVRPRVCAEAVWSVNFVAPMLFAVPVISGLAAWLIPDETIAPGQIAGTAVVITGLILDQLRQHQKAQPGQFRRDRSAGLKVRG